MSPQPIKERIKYFRTAHLPFSPGCTNDDKKLLNIEHFYKMNTVIISEKFDGENFTGYCDGYTHARSLDSNNHASRNYAKAIWKKVCHELPKGWRICAENLYAKHSIHYEHLTSYLLVFSIWDDTNTCLDWETTELWCSLLNLKTVPVIYKGKISSKDDLDDFINATWWQYCHPVLPYEGDEKEGFVIRNSDGFKFKDSDLNIAKYVRSGHVQTDSHWMTQEIVPNKLEKK